MARPDGLMTSPFQPDYYSIYFAALLSSTMRIFSESVKNSKLLFLLESRGTHPPALIAPPKHQGCLRTTWLARVSRILFPTPYLVYKINPNPRKIMCCGKKSGPNAAFKPMFSWVGLALGWGVRRFHNNIYTLSNPTEFW